MQQSETASSSSSSSSSLAASSSAAAAAPMRRCSSRPVTIGCYIGFCTVMTTPTPPGEVVTKAIHRHSALEYCSIWLLNMSALEALCDYALYKSTFTLHYITFTLHYTALTVGLSVRAARLTSYAVAKVTHLSRMARSTFRYLLHCRTMYIWRK